MSIFAVELQRFHELPRRPRDGDVELAGRAPRDCDQLLTALCRHGRVDDQRQRDRGDLGDGGEILHRRSQAPVERRVDRVSAGVAHLMTEPSGVARAVNCAATTPFALGGCPHTVWRSASPSFGASSRAMKSGPCRRCCHDDRICLPASAPTGRGKPESRHQGKPCCVSSWPLLSNFDFRLSTSLYPHHSGLMPASAHLRPGSTSEASSLANSAEY